jgi:hypothetical protein
LKPAVTGIGVGAGQRRHRHPALTERIMPDHDTQHTQDTRKRPSSASARAGSTPAQEVFLGVETNQCSGSLSVRNRAGKLIPITRGVETVVDVAISGSGYWFWHCGTAVEKSRGGENFRQRVKRLKVTHSTGNREITWRCFDLL